MPRGTLVTDPALLDLINVITLEREKEAPPPPLYMFTAQSTKGYIVFISYLLKFKTFPSKFHHKRKEQWCTGMHTLHFRL